MRDEVIAPSSGGGGEGSSDFSNTISGSRGIHFFPYLRYRIHLRALQEEIIKYISVKEVVLYNN